MSCPPLPQTPTLSVELRALIEKKNILTTRSKAKVLRDLDRHINKSKEKLQHELKLKAREEIFTSEVSYLNQLEITIKYFKNPLQDSKYCVPQGLKTVFDNLESVYNVNGELLNQLKKNTEDVAEAFRELAPFFKLYSVYAYSYRQGLDALKALHRNNPKLESFIKKQECRPEVGTKLCSLLIAPVQRIPRYRLLLKELLSHTPESDPTFLTVKDALKKVEASTEHINSLIQEQENMERIVELQKSLTGGKPVLVAPGRRLVKEGVLMKVSKNGKKAMERYFVLLNDVLLYCKMGHNPIGTPNSLNCCCILPLRKCHVHHVLGDKVFNITCQTFTIIVYCEDPTYSESWISAIRRAIEKEEQGRSTLNKKSNAAQVLRKKDVNIMTETLTPRKRKKSQSDSDGLCSPFLSPWKRKKDEKKSEDGSSRWSENVKSFKRAIFSVSQTLQRYWYFPKYLMHPERQLTN